MLHAVSRVKVRKLVLRHYVLHAPPNFRYIVSIMAKFNAAFCLVKRVRKSGAHDIFNFIVICYAAPPRLFLNNFWNI